MEIKYKKNGILWGLSGLGYLKNNIQGGLSKNGGLGQFADLRGGSAKTLRWCF